MTKLPDESARNVASQTAAARPKRGVFLNIMLSLAVLAAGIGAAAYINKTAPKARKRSAVKMTPLVEVISVQPEEQQVRVPAMGTVIPAREIVLESRVSGEIVAIHPEFTVGGFLEEGTEALRIDPQDYQLALTLAQARVKDAESKLKLLEAEAAAAKEEWGELYRNAGKSLGEPPPLVIKQPQLAAAKAMVAAEKAELKKAQLELQRTELRVPFNAIVRAKHVDIGSQVSVQDRLAELVGTDEYWIQASVPVDRLDWIQIPRNPRASGSKVRVSYRNGHERVGTIIKLLGDLETEGRMARVLVEVKDPLSLEATQTYQPPLLIGEYVRMEIEGRQLQNVYRIPRTALRDDSTIWVVLDDGRLEIRQVETVWRDTNYVLLRDDLRPGDRVIVSDLATPVDGMPVQVSE